MMNKTVSIIPLFVKHYFSIWDVSSYLSLLIRWVIGFKYNHVAILYEEDGMCYVVESRSSGVFKSTYRNWLLHRPNKNWEEGKCLDVEIIDVNIRLGNKYNILSLFYHIIYRVSGVWLGSRLDTQENCSQFLADILKRNNAYLDTPKSLYKSLSRGTI